MTNPLDAEQFICAYCGGRADMNTIFMFKAEDEAKKPSIMVSYWACDSCYVTERDNPKPLVVLKDGLRNIDAMKQGEK